MNRVAVTTSFTTIAIIAYLAWQRKRLGAAKTGSVVDVSRLPMVDIGRFVRGSAAEKREVAKEWDEAFCSIGFCLLTGYEAFIPEAVVSELRKQAAIFFVGNEKARAYHDG